MNEKRHGESYRMEEEEEDGVIPIFGYVTTIPLDTTKLQNQIVRIQGYQNNDLIFNKYVKTEGTGIFNASFYPPNDGIVTIKAMLVNQANSTAEGLITVVATEAWMPAILITIFIASSIGCLVIFWAISTRTKDDTYMKIGLIPATILTILAYILLYKFPPLDAAGNAAIAAALITPMGAYIYGALQARSGDQPGPVQSS
jgi:hypothetical protein